MSYYWRFFFLISLDGPDGLKDTFEEEPLVATVMVIILPTAIIFLALPGLIKQKLFDDFDETLMDLIDLVLPTPT